jgi:NAD(P)-dependent dehydrogenase (short-subunit alcohol dehydrogenase family)
MNLNGKIVLIVGGATGIGRATAALCAKRGAQVVVADRDETAGLESAQTCGGLFVPVNVTDEVSVHSMIAAVEKEFGRLDALVHTAGILKGAFVPLEEFSLETFRMVLDINTTGSFLCAKESSQLMKKSGKGTIVLLSSGAATGGSSSFAYGTSKGGVHSLGIVLANGLAKDNIRVNVVAPGNIDTPMKRSVIEADVQRRGKPEEMEKAVADSNLGTPEGIAKLLAWLVSDDADYVRGLISTR